MSAYIVSEKVINVIVNLIAPDAVAWSVNGRSDRVGKLLRAAQEDGLVESREFPCGLGDTWLDSERSEFFGLLGRALWSMNINAVSQRYSDCVHATSVDDDGKCTVTGKHQLPGPVPNPNPHDYEFKAIPINKKAAIGSAYSEFNYQCLEGDVPETDLFKALQSMIGGMAVGIITEEHRSQETQNAIDLEEAQSQVQIWAGM